MPSASAATLVNEAIPVPKVPAQLSSLQEEKVADSTKSSAPTEETKAAEPTTLLASVKRSSFWGWGRATESKPSSPVAPSSPVSALDSKSDAVVPPATPEVKKPVQASISSKDGTETSEVSTIAEVSQPEELHSATVFESKTVSRHDSGMVLSETLEREVKFQTSFEAIAEEGEARTPSLAVSPVPESNNSRKSSTLSGRAISAFSRMKSWISAK
ncbi:hypothetical protein BCR33DRAFT_572715 [Rhizoclosmatium globosum]|uniref:Uncharacterized protein n=1 Tax=Rhizoclosmatium globosum TaxID=329046 RepID=A0A1Y2B5G7_9FUNG|nr:hypothetical protein BCR33DRAFT_572715 [Rhizoclosmatium globosum]|eukprot:ORY29946.1 hypothetical protein BCR33DRAFT_572715 [Rhizoclosmatium globosum]